MNIDELNIGGPRSKLDQVTELNDRGRQFCALVLEDGLDPLTAGRLVGWKRRSVRYFCRSAAFHRALNEKKAQQNGQ
jgi:hypothetical protein